MSHVMQHKRHILKEMEYTDKEGRLFAAELIVERNMLHKLFS